MAVESVIRATAAADDEVDSGDDGSRASPSGSLVEAVEGGTVKKGVLYVFRAGRRGVVSARRSWKPADVLVTTTGVFVRYSTLGRWHRVDLTGLKAVAEPLAKTRTGSFHVISLARPGGAEVVRLSTSDPADHQEWLEVLSAVVAEMGGEGEPVGAAAAVFRWRFNDINRVGKVSPWRYSRWAPVVAGLHDLQEAEDNRPLSVDISVDGSRETRDFLTKQEAVEHLNSLVLPRSECRTPPVPEDGLDTDATVAHVQPVLVQLPVHEPNKENGARSGTLEVATAVTSKHMVLASTWSPASLFSDLVAVVLRKPGQRPELPPLVRSAIAAVLSAWVLALFRRMSLR